MTFWCPSDILIMSWCSTWPGNHLVPCVAVLVRSCILIHAYRCLPDPKCLLYPSGLSLCLCVDHFCLSLLMTWFSSTAWSVMADLWVTLLFLALEVRVCVPCDFFLVLLNPQTKLPACLPNVWAWRYHSSSPLHAHSFSTYSLYPFIC